MSSKFKIEAEIRQYEAEIAEKNNKIGEIKVFRK